MQGNALKLEKSLRKMLLYSKNVTKIWVEPVDPVKKYSRPLPEYTDAASRTMAPTLGDLRYSIKDKQDVGSALVHTTITAVEPVIDKIYQEAITRVTDKPDPIEHVFVCKIDIMAIIDKACKEAV